MIKLIKIAFLIIFFIPSLGVYGQYENCPEKVLLLKYYQEKKFDKAKVMLDSVLSACPNQKDNPYYWHLSGFVNYFVFKQVDNKSPISKARDIAIESFKKSLELDKKKEFVDNNKSALSSLARSYYNHAVFYLDTVHYDDAQRFYNEYKNLERFIDPNKDFKNKDIEFNLALATQYRIKYLNKKKERREFLDKAILCYKNTLSIDSTNYSANYNTGILYHNLGVDLILEELADDAELEKVIMMEEQALENFSKSLPYLKRAYNSKPNDKSIIQGIIAVYYSLNEMENYVKYANILKKLNSESESQKN
ncbi:MAG: hypothetical protein CL846_00560 [Crocinitomicaceae bacterium]|nr:hypothetical protein [Crocinitomicaceae bacterium]|tara:strand:- start:4979 stop:5899 length:921 start_codon:yes stop_codon:yes gene_type:complete